MGSNDERKKKELHKLCGFVSRAQPVSLGGRQPHVSVLVVPKWLDRITKEHADTSTPSSAQGVHTIVRLPQSESGLHGSQCIWMSLADDSGFVSSCLTASLRIFLDSVPL